MSGSTIVEINSVEFMAWSLIIAVLFVLNKATGKWHKALKCVIMITADYVNAGFLRI